MGPTTKSRFTWTSLLHFMNWLGLTYFLVMLASVALICTLVIAPTYKQPCLHQATLAFFSLQIFGNYLLAISTNTSHGGKVGETSNDRPPGAHYCKLCRKVILRRDHHCFFMYCCIGKYNQCYFIVYCLYIMLGGLYAVILQGLYLNQKYSVKFSSPFTLLTLLPRTFYEFFIEAVTPSQFLLTVVMYSTLVAALTCAGFFYWEMTITFDGQTSHEALMGKRKDGKGAWENMIDVLGKYWYLRFVVPYPFKTLEVSDVNGKECRKVLKKKAKRM